MTDPDKDTFNPYPYVAAGIAGFAFLVIIYLIFFRGWSGLFDTFGEAFTANLLGE